MIKVYSWANKTIHWTSLRRSVSLARILSAVYLQSIWSVVTERSSALDHGLKFWCCQNFGLNLGLADSRGLCL